MKTRDNPMAEIREIANMTRNIMLQPPTQPKRFCQRCGIEITHHNPLRECNKCDELEDERG